MSVLFLDIDTQIDFIYPEGALYVPGADTLIPVYKKLSALALNKRIPVYASADAHAQDDPEFGQFPAHCLKGQPGQQKISETNPGLFFSEPNDGKAVRREHLVRSHVLFEKQSFDVFSNPKIDIYLKALKPDKVIVYGVATDYCVQAAVQSLLQRDFAVWLVRDAVKAVKPENEQSLLQTMHENGVRLISSKDLTEAL